MLCDFAEYIINEGYTTLEKITEADNKTVEAEELKEKNRIEKIEAEKKEKREEKEKEENFKRSIIEDIKKYDNKNLIELVKEIHLDVLGEYIPCSAIRVLVLIDKFDIEEYKKETIEMLHNGNKAS